MHQTTLNQKLKIIIHSIIQKCSAILIAKNKNGVYDESKYSFNVSIV